MKRQMTARETLEKLAEALGRETVYRFAGLLSVDFDPVGQVSKERAKRIAYLTYRVGVFESVGHVTTFINRDGSVAGWRLTQKGQEASRRREGRD